MSSSLDFLVYTLNLSVCTPANALSLHIDTKHSQQRNVTYLMAITLSISYRRMRTETRGKPEILSALNCWPATRHSGQGAH
jgi:hypothetical protein